jgi:hypothetical protein
MSGTNETSGRTSSTVPWNALEQWSATLFLVAGGLLVVHTVIHVLMAFTNVTYPFHHEVPFGVVGMILGLIALLGLYPQLGDRSPKLARTGAILAVLATFGWLVIGTTALAEDLGMSPPDWLGIFGILTILTFSLGYLVFSAAGLRTDIIARATALAVGTPVVVMVYNLSVALTTGGTREGQVIVAAGFALTHFVIGAALRVENFPTGHAESAPSMAT